MTDRGALLMCYGYLKATEDTDEFMLSLLATQLFGKDDGSQSSTPPPEAEVLGRR